MKTILACVLLAAAVPAFADTTIMDNKQSKTIDCAKDPVATIMGNDNNVALTGTCTTVTVQGNHNKVAIASSATVSVTGNENTVAAAAVDTLDVTGNKNVVDYKGPVTKGGATRVSNTGTGNKVKPSR
jgi:hypothetical protein